MNITFALSPLYPSKTSIITFRQSDEPININFNNQKISSENPTLKNNNKMLPKFNTRIFILSQY